MTFSKKQSNLVLWAFMMSTAVAGCRSRSVQNSTSATSSETQAHDEATETPTSYYAFSYLCESLPDSSVGGSPFYGDFIKASSKLKFGFVAFYKKIDKAIINNANSHCADARKGVAAMQRFIQDENKICKDTCGSEAPSYHSDDWAIFRTSNINKHVTECSNLCDQYLEEQKTALSQSIHTD